MNANRTAPNRQLGMSVPELMIALLLSSMIMVGLISLFVQSKRSFNQDDIVSRMQEDARFAVNELQADISMAGFWADLLDPSVIQNESLSGSLYTYTTAITVSDNVSGSVTLLGQSLPDIVSGTDAIAIVKVNGGPVYNGTDSSVDDDSEASTFQSSVLEDSSVYLRTNGVIGRMSKGSDAPTGANSVPYSFSYWEYQPVIYWVRSYATTSGDGIPTLCRKVLDSGTVTTECLSQGIEDMQIEYGVDTDGDDFADQYIADPSAAQMKLVTSVRVYLLGRSTTSDPNYANHKTYTYSNSAIAPDDPGDGYYRRVYTTTIMIRNNAHYMGLTS